MQHTDEWVERRALNTRGAQDEVKETWLWEEKTIADWDAQIAAVNTAEETAASLEAEMLRLRGVLDGQLDDLHNRTVQGTVMARVRYRGDADALILMKHLKMKGNGRQRVLADALAWESVWSKLPDADWNPTPANTRAEFTTLRGTAQQSYEAYVHSVDTYRKASEAHHAAVAHLAADCVAWYRAACTVFSEDTPEGRMVRGVIPTTSGGSGAAAKPAATQPTTTA